MCSGIPSGTYELKIGNSWDAEKPKNAGSSGIGEFNTLRFDFKPKSLEENSEAYIAFGPGNETVQVVVPKEKNSSEEQVNEDYTIFKGAKKALKGDKECLLLYDQVTGELRLEKINANIFVKKTREGNDKDEVKLKSDVHKLRSMKLEKMRSEQHSFPPVDSPVTEDGSVKSAATAASVLQNDLQLSESSDEED